MNIFSKTAILAIVAALGVGVTGCGDDASTSTVSSDSAIDSRKLCEVASAYQYYGDRAAGKYGPVQSDSTMKVLWREIVQTDRDLVAAVPERWRSIAKKVERHAGDGKRLFAAAGYDSRKLDPADVTSYAKRSHVIGREARPMASWLKKTCEAKVQDYGERPSDAPSVL